MSARVIMAGLAGFAVGNLPDHGSVWLGIKLAFTLALVWLLVRVARQEARS